MSGTPVTLAGTTRWPSSRVRVRMVPRPRSENELRPCWPLEVLNVPVVAPVEPCSDGSWVMAVKMFGWAARSSSAWPRTWVGVGAVKPVDRIRVPVTTISVKALALGPTAPAVCAWAAPAVMTSRPRWSRASAQKGRSPRVRPTALILHPSQFFIETIVRWPERNLSDDGTANYTTMVVCSRVEPDNERKTEARTRASGLSAASPTHRVQRVVAQDVQRLLVRPAEHQLQRAFGDVDRSSSLPSGA
jgi:hypothetical protein